MARTEKESRLICHHCGEAMVGVQQTYVGDGYIRRQRMCGYCRATWTTYEIRQEEFDKLLAKEGKLNKIIEAINELLN
jgi:transcriptional regulator NrdR family protein